MKLALNLFLSIFALFTFDNVTFSLTNYQIRKICKKAKKESTCIKKFQVRKDKLNDGDLIEIPVIPYEGN